MAGKLGQTNVQRVFFENPTKDFHIREISRMLNLSKTSVAHHVNQLLKTNLITSKKNVFKGYSADENSHHYRFYKLMDGLKRIFESGLSEYLETLNPKCIILFGSFAKAEYDQSSDIDLFLQASEQKVDLTKFEKELKHKINILFEPKLNKLSPSLLNNVINGLKLAGYIKLK